MVDRGFLGVHGTAVAIGGHGILLLGTSGSGKSDLALRLIDRGASLITDDLVRVERRGNLLVMTASDRNFGRIEVRGVGICDVPAIGEAELLLCVELGTGEPRFPLEVETRSFHDLNVPLVRLDAFGASAPIKVEMAVRNTVQALSENGIT